MGRKKVEKKKMPTDYPQISFRVSKENKNKLIETISRVQTLMNKAREQDSSFVNKNDVFVKALFLGLDYLKKQ